MNPISHSYSAWRSALSSLCKAGCAVTLAALSAGCTQTDLTDGLTGGGAKIGSYVTLSLTTPSAPAMRSNPTGGEQGDGLETGQDYENEVKSAVAFFYQGSGVNAEGTTPIQAAVEFRFSESQASAGGGNGVDSVYTTTPQTVDLDNGTYQVLLVANPGTDDWWLGKSLTLDDVRNHIQKEAWKQENGSYSDFVMTSAADASLTLNFNPQDNPATATVNVERMAARLDYQADGSYTCQDPQYSNATVEITGAALVNNLTAGSYLTKRVATDVNGTTGLSYLGDETADEGVQTNYVLDPWTAQKTANNDNFTIGDATAQSASALYGVWLDESWTDPNRWASYVQPGAELGGSENNSGGSEDNAGGSEVWRRIGYTLENTTAAAEAGSRYSTGVVFKAKFHPTGLGDKYKKGDTFFSYNSKLYASMEDLMTHFYGSVFTDDFNKITSYTTWGEVKKFITSTLLTNDPSGYYTWLKNQADRKDDAEVVTETDAQKLTWSQYMWTECGYSKDADGVKLDQNGKITRTALRPTGVRTYEDATCYYTWWVRHSNDEQDNTNGVMEYAIVRNNIYKLTVKSIYSLGGDIPTDKDDELVIEVRVNDWTLLDHEYLPM